MVGWLVVGWLCGWLVDWWLVVGWLVLGVVGARGGGGWWLGGGQGVRGLSARSGGWVLVGMFRYVKQAHVEHMLNMSLFRISKYTRGVC